MYSNYPRSSLTPSLLKPGHLRISYQLAMLYMRSFLTSVSIILDILSLERSRQFVFVGEAQLRRQSAAVIVMVANNTELGDFNVGLCLFECETKS